ncbi:Ubiquitin recognition factor in ER-associated degradation protein 1 [Chionoecetes opilio]|uniref:Ubiquitin recognition factor in ER-associated degradation protein 1 n=1 Tax=Chionoecetes opilio TaxID=41210 RepID=A0A8J4YP20_CHIOP|nr:Ubiquitin recognition factor in ER-associated degradation protein 1 [Chionoecetes opilio]
MPPSALDVLTRLNIVYPMLFKLTNQRANRHTHCGVLEFVADEGKVYIPTGCCDTDCGVFPAAMMRNLLLDEGELVHIESRSLPVATFSKFEPQSVEFLDITNPKAVLENALRNFACLTQDDVVALNYNDRIYEMRVLEVKPGNAVSIIECDMNVEFAPAVGYQEPEKMDTTSQCPRGRERRHDSRKCWFLLLPGLGEQAGWKEKEPGIASRGASQETTKTKGDSRL